MHVLCMCARIQPVSQSAHQNSVHIGHRNESVDIATMYTCEGRFHHASKRNGPAAVRAKREITMLFVAKVGTVHARPQPPSGRAKSWARLCAIQSRHDPGAARSRTRRLLSTHPPERQACGQVAAVSNVRPKAGRRACSWMRRRRRVQCTGFPPLRMRIRVPSPDVARKASKKQYRTMAASIALKRPGSVVVGCRCLRERQPHLRRSPKLPAQAQAQTQMLSLENPLRIGHGSG